MVYGYDDDHFADLTAEDCKNACTGATNYTCTFTEFGYSASHGNCWLSTTPIEDVVTSPSVGFQVYIPTKTIWDTGKFKIYVFSSSAKPL